MASPEQNFTPISGEGTGESSQSHTPGDSASASRRGSRPTKKGTRIHWQSEGESMDTKKQKATFNVRDHSEPSIDNPPKPLPRLKRERESTRSGSQSPQGDFTESVTEALKNIPSSKPSILRRTSSDFSAKDDSEFNNVEV